MTSGDRTRARTRRHLLSGSRPREVAPGVHLLTTGRTAAASNVYLVDAERGWALVDTGWPGSVGAVTSAVESLHGRGARPTAILLTHMHPDHSGAAGPLARAWQVPVHVHPDELVMAAGRYVPEYGMPLDRWLVMPLMRLLPARTRTRVEDAGSITDVVQPLGPDGVVPGLPGWRWVHTPGHTPGHVAFLREADGLLISGDAVVTVDLNSLRGVLTRRSQLSGPPRYTTWDWPAAVRSVSTLAALAPQLLAPGHGRPWTTGTAEGLRALADRLGESLPQR